MVNKTAIEWADYTSNPIKFRTLTPALSPAGEREKPKSVWACVRKSPGCAHCYAADLAKRYRRGGEFTAAEMSGYKCYLDEAELRELLSVRKLPAGSRCFLGDMTDVFGEWVPFEYLDRVFAVMALRPDVVFQVLTKRPERMREYVADFGTYNRVRLQQIGLALPPPSPWPLPNVWLGTSVENQRWAIRVAHLLKAPAAVHFVSYEPALGPVDFTLINLGKQPGQFGDFDQYLDALNGLHCDGMGFERAMAEKQRLNWIIVGGESGPKSRPFDVGWGRRVVEQCKAAGVACFVKQLGANVRDRNDAGFLGDPGDAWDIRDFSRIQHDPDGWRAEYQGAPVRIRLESRRGGGMEEWPADLRVREFPALTDVRASDGVA